VCVGFVGGGWGFGDVGGWGLVFDSVLQCVSGNRGVVGGVGGAWVVQAGSCVVRVNVGRGKLLDEQATWCGTAGFVSGSFGSGEKGDD
jgi:hypothetical protein